ncbi:MAG TPA: alpha/beta fold hydrolase, partial [Acidimicrobiales bacterium]|nr:alpha/beta fold hydrolase [Acidimicrobiales bacterium]
HRRVAVLALLALLAVGCSSGGGDSGSDDALAPPGEPTAAAERPVQFVGAGKVRLFGTFTMPETRAGESVPGVLVLPSAGAGDRNGIIGTTGVADPLGRDLAAAFTNAGLATYRYDQRGTGESRIEPDVRLTMDDLVADARAALDLLEQRRETAGKDLSVVAYDQGGLVALRLAAVDQRVKRLVLISTPGRSLVDVRAAQLSERYGQESTDALRALVAGLLATRTLPPIDAMRTELRGLFPPQEAEFLAELYGMDPAAEAAKVKVPAMIVVPADPAPYDPQRLAAALPGSQVVNSVGSGPTLVISGETPEDESDPAGASHVHGAGPPVAATQRDRAALDRMSQFLAAAARPA